MLKIRVVRDVGSRVAYHKGGLALNDREKFGRWLGSAVMAAAFVATGIPAADLAAALAGYTATGSYMGQRRSSKRRAAWDVVLSPHKSISVGALCLSKTVREGIRQAWEDAVATTVTAMESLACTSNGKAGISATGNLLVAAFTHERSRRDDPHLHTHCLVMNGTMTAAGWRSLEPVAFFRHNLLLDAILQRELARNLRAAGFTVVLDAKGRATLPGFPDALLAHFSQAKRALDAADTSREYGSLASIGNSDVRRNLLNDRLRPAKRPPTRALVDLIDSPTRRAISHRLRPIHAQAAAAPTPSPQVLAGIVTPIYQRSSLWPSTKRLFRSLVEASRIEAAAPFTDFLRAIPFIRPPNPHPLSATASTRYAARRLLRARAAALRRGPALRPRLAHPRLAAVSLLHAAKRRLLLSRSLLNRQAKRVPAIVAASRHALAAAQRAKVVWQIVRRQHALAIARNAATTRTAAVAAATRRARSPAAPQGPTR